MDVSKRFLVSDDGYVPWWYTRTGVIVRWVIFAVVLFLILAYVIGGYYHAKLRLKKGKQPLAYHSCLVPRRTYQPSYASGWPQQHGYYNPHGNAYPMNEMPLPVYDANRPPVYSGSAPAGSKIDPSQRWDGQTNRPAETSPPAPTYTPEQQPPR